MMLMRGLVIVLVAAFATAAVIQSRSKSEWKKFSKQIMKECTTQLQLPGNFTQFLEKSTDKAKKCLAVKCYDEKFLGPWKTLDEWNEKVVAFYEDFWAKDVDKKNKLLEIYNLCKDKTGADDCEIMLEKLKCGREEFMKMKLPVEEMD